ncbi:MAG: right-handed parallel beta-helix repeat-containing protein [Candidatus Hodarchaeales archaeon]
MIIGINTILSLNEKTVFVTNQQSYNIQSSNTSPDTPFRIVNELKHETNLLKKQDLSSRNYDTKYYEIFTSSALPQTNYTFHEPIEISSNNQFELMGFPGNGTFENPYRIEGLEIISDTNDLLIIRDTDVFFQVSNNLFDGRYGDVNGINFVNVRNADIKNNIIYSVKTFAIGLTNSKNSIIENNTINYADQGIYLSNSPKNKILTNSIKNINGIAIVSVNSNSNTVSDNYIRWNKKGVYFFASNHNTISNNDIHNNDEDGIYLTGMSNSNKVNDNHITSSQQGIHIMQKSSSNTINNNSISYNEKGIWIRSLANLNSVVHNEITKNYEFGIYLINTCNTNIYSNEIMNNDQYGIYLGFDSENNTIIQNYFSQNQGNSSQAYDDGLNNIFAYNYWEEWTTPDIDANNIVDEFYSIDGVAENKDGFPLTPSFTLNEPIVVIVTKPVTVEPLNLDEESSDQIYDFLFNLVLIGIAGLMIGVAFLAGLMYKDFKNIGSEVKTEFTRRKEAVINTKTQKKSEDVFNPQSPHQEVMKTLEELVKEQE